MIKAILFDMDGVLVDAREWHYEALNRALEIFGMKISLDSHLSTFDGLPTKRKLQILGKSRGLPASLHDFVNELKQTYTQEIMASRCKPTFNHQYALSNLKRLGYRMTVCSNSIRRTVVSMMELTQLSPYFDFLLSNEDVSKAKPDPEIYLTAMDRLGLPPSQCMIVEDNENGIQAARASGAHTMLVGAASDVTFDRIMSEIRKVEGHA
jgi:HAD superfamily hydrolase (TIGR01509 family)